MPYDARHVRDLLIRKLVRIYWEMFWQSRTSRRGICFLIFCRPVVDVTRLIPHARAVDKIKSIERKAVIQADVFSQHSVDNTPSRDSGE
jgi:hypothetical protein